MIPFLLGDYDPKGRKPDARRLSLLHSLGYENACDLAMQAITENVFDDIQVAAINALKDKAENEELLLSLAAGKKADVREAALLALAETGSQKGRKLALETLQSGKYAVALKAARAIKDAEFVRETVEIARQVYKDCKECGKEKKNAAVDRFEALVRVFIDREEECVIDFCKEICADSEKSKTAGPEALRLIAARYFNWAVGACSPEEVYDTCKGMYVDSVLVYSNRIKPAEGSVFDKRWLPTFILKKDTDFLCLAVKPEDTDAVQFLVHYLEEYIRSKQYLAKIERCIEKLIEIGYKGLDKILFAAMEKSDWARRGFGNTVIEYADKVFSRDYIEKLEALFKKSGSWHVGEIASKLKEAYGVEAYNK
jgi:hypothetical protein